MQGQKSKVFEGIIIIVSNLGFQLTYGMSPAMIDRFIPVGFSPRLGEANPNLAKQLNVNQSGLVNLLMGINPSIFKNLTRAGLINKEVTYESNVLIPFILTKLFFEVGSAVSIVALNQGYRQWVLMQNEKKKNNSTFDLVIDTASVALSMFNRRLIKDRRLYFGKRTTVLVGIRWREKTDPN